MTTHTLAGEPAGVELDIVRDPRERTVSMFDPEDPKGERWIRCDEELLVEGWA